MLVPNTRLAKQVALFKRMGMFALNDTSVLVRRAITVDDLEAAYRLVHDVFVEKGYIARSPRGARVRLFETFPEMATFVCQIGRDIAAVMSIVPDSPDAGLPSDQGFRAEIDSLRRAGRRVCEITNLAVRNEYRRSNAFPELTRACFAHARIMGCDDIFIAISPGHGPFFEDVLRFDAFGDKRNYSAEKEDPVEGKRMDLHGIEQRWLEADRALGDAAFLHNYYFQSNPFNDCVRPWATLAAGTFRNAGLLHELFVERTGALAQFGEEGRQAVARRWGDAVLAQVLYQTAEMAVA